MLHHNQKGKIEFYDPQHEDRVHVVETYCSEMIAAFSEAQRGI